MPRLYWRFIRMSRRAPPLFGLTKTIPPSNLVCLAAFALATALAPTPVTAQTPTASAVADSLPKKRACFRGRPLPVCDHYWLTEFGVAATIRNEDGYQRGPLFTWELGGMKNVSEKNAFGAAVFAEAGPSNGLGLRPRYRRWLGGGRSVEFAPGVRLLSEESGKSFSGHVALNFSDYAAVSLHVVSIRH